MKRTTSFIVFAAALFAGAMYGYSQEPQITTDGIDKNNYSSVFDTASVWHPERILIEWPGMRLDILLPREKERSGVANLFIRDRDSGAICLLDSVKVNPTYGKRVFRGYSANGPILAESRPIAAKSYPNLFIPDSIKYYRYANRFEPGSYDIILLYNNGKYITCENISFETIMRKIVDMTALRARKADKNSRRWLELRKFTDIVGQRALDKYYDGTSPHKIIGYLFSYKGRAEFRSGEVWLSKNDNEVEKRVKTSFDGFFELDVDSDDEIYQLELFDVIGPHVNVEAQANTWIFAVRKGRSWRNR